MKVTRKQLRRLILNEVRIKPEIPYASEEQYAKIMDLARTDDGDNSQKNQADSLADALGYDPVQSGEIYDEEEDEDIYIVGQHPSFSEELYRYDKLLGNYLETRYLHDRLDNSGLASFVEVYESELSKALGRSYSLEDLKGILNDLNPVYDAWELKFNTHNGEYSFVYDQQDPG